MAVRKIKGKGKRRKKQKQPPQIVFYREVIKEIDRILQKHGFQREHLDYGSKGKRSIHNNYAKTMEEWGKKCISISINKYSYMMKIDYDVIILYPNEEENSIIYYTIAHNRIFEKWLKKYWFFRGYRNKRLKAQILRRVEDNLKWFDHFSQPEKILWIYENVTLKLPKGEKDPVYKTSKVGTAKDVRVYHFLRQLTEARKAQEKVVDDSELS